MADETAHTDARAALISLVELSQAREEAFRAELSATERNLVGTAEQWAPKEVVAHLGYWKHRQVARVEAMVRGEEPPEGPDWGQLNTETWPEHARLTWDESVARSDQATRDLIAALQRLTNETLANLDDQASQGDLLIDTTLAIRWGIWRSISPITTAAWATLSAPPKRSRKRCRRLSRPTWGHHTRAARATISPATMRCTGRRPTRLTSYVWPSQNAPI